MIRAVLLVLGMLPLLAAPSVADAHAVLEASEPADRAVLAAAPSAIVLRFNEPVRPIAARVLDGEGRVVAVDIETAGGDARIALPDGLGDGAYLVSYRVSSADSHPVGGTIMFALGAAPAGWADVAADDGRVWTALVVALRAVQDAALLVGAGGALFLLLFARADPGMVARLRPLLRTAAALGAVVAVLGLGAQGGALRGGSPALLLDASTWSLGIAWPRGAAVGIALAGLALLTFGLRDDRAHGRRATLGLGAVLALAPFLMVGHAATSTPRWVAVPALLLHVGVAAFWIGALVPLLTALGHAAPARASGLVRRFGGLAAGAVPVLLAAGVALAWLRISSPAALPASDYGRLLLAKLALAGVLLAVAAWNRWRLTPRLLGGRSGAASGLRAAIRLEIVLVALILIMSAALGRTAPPVVGPAADRHAVTAPDRHGRSVAITLSPGRAGRNAVGLALADAAGRPLPARSVILSFALPAAGIEPIERPAVVEGEGRWRHDGPELALPGRWRLGVAALIDDFDLAVFEVDLPVE